MGKITLRCNAARYDVTIEKDGVYQCYSLNELEDHKKIAASLFKWALKGFPYNSKLSPEL